MTRYDTADFIVVGSGCAGLAAALRAAVAGLNVLIVEKSDRLGGTSAMSGGGVWIPANHHARAAGLEDSPAEALNYLHAAAPEGWAQQEAALWQAFVETAPEMLQFLERHSPLRFALTDEPDPLAELPGGKSGGRMLSPLPLSRRLLGSYRRSVRRSTLPHLFTYHEMVGTDPYHEVLGTVALAPRLLGRVLTDSAGQGNALVIGLLKGCLDAGCRIQTATRCRHLIQDGDGRVTGVEAETAQGRITLHTRRGVLLATGGFEWNAALAERHFPGGFERIGSPATNEGDGHAMAEAAGARLDRMDQANIFPLLPTRYEGRPSGLPTTFQAEPHAIVVDRTGKRFFSEYSYNFGEALDRRDANGRPIHLPAWLIADSRFLRAALPFHWYRRYDPDWVRRADTLEELAGLIGLPPDALAATVERFNRQCDQGRDADFQRGESLWERYKAGDRNPLGRIDRPPFHAMRLGRCTVGTKGGVRVDAGARALDAWGRAIPGLYSAGNAMANPIGTRAVGAGTTLGPCMTWGYIAAGSALAQPDPHF